MPIDPNNEVSLHWGAMCDVGEITLLPLVLRERHHHRLGDFHTARISDEPVAVAILSRWGVTLFDMTGLPLPKDALRTPIPDLTEMFERRIDDRKKEGTYPFNSLKRL